LNKVKENGFKKLKCKEKEAKKARKTNIYCKTHRLNNT